MLSRFAWLWPSALCCFALTVRERERETDRDREGQSICLRISVIKFLFIFYLLPSKKIKLLQFDCFFYSCC